MDPERKPQVRRQRRNIDRDLFSRRVCTTVTEAIGARLDAAATAAECSTAAVARLAISHGLDNALRTLRRNRGRNRDHNRDHERDAPAPEVTP